MVDSSVVVAALVDSGPVGQWAERTLRESDLAAPHLLPAEVANVLRGAMIKGDITSDTASLAFTDLVDLPIHLLPFEPVADRVWHLRDTLTSYDAWYVALAEALDARMATLDHRLATALGPACRFVVPPA